MTTKIKCNYRDTCEAKTDQCGVKLKAKPVIKNKFWIVENGSENVGTIEKVDDGVVYNSGRKRTFFKSIRNLTDNLNIVISTSDGAKIRKQAQDTGGYPTQHTPHNVLYDVKHRTYVYTKSAKSKSYYCAGYFDICLNGIWERAFCPKLITIQRYPFRGPYMETKELVL